MSENLRHFLLAEVFGITREEIVIQYLADSQKQIGVNETMGKQIVHMLTRIVQPRSQPGDGSPLPCEFFLDKVSDMWYFLRGHVLEFWV